MISNVMYDTQTKTFYVHKKNDQQYAFFDVPEFIYVSFMSSNDKDEYFLSEIKDKFREKKLSS